MFDLHPTAEQLAAFRLGRLDKFETLEVEKHVAVCPKCGRRLKGLPRDPADSAAPRSEREAARPDAASAPKRLRRVAFGFLLLLALGALAYFTVPGVRDLAHTALRFVANKAVLEIEAADEDVEITIKQAGAAPRVLVVHKNTKEMLELPALDGQIVARELPRGLRARTTPLELARGGSKCFKASFLLAANPSSLAWGVLSIVNRNTTATEFLHIRLADEEDDSFLGEHAILEPGEALSRTMPLGTYEIWTSQDGEYWMLAATLNVTPGSRLAHEISEGSMMIREMAAGDREPESP